MKRPNRGLTEQVAAAIRAGTSPEIAAAAFGVARATFARWRRPSRDPDRRAFRKAIDEAAAQARLRAEIDVFNNRPRDWLQFGPGRETPSAPGWTAAVKPGAKSRETLDPFATPEIAALLNRLADAVAEFPGASARVALTIDEFDLRRNRHERRT